MELKIYNKDLELIGFYDDFNSLKWNDRYNTVGQFEIQTNMTNRTKEFLLVDNVVVCNGLSGVIESVQYDIDESGVETITASGSDLTSFLKRRINTAPFIHEGSTAALILRLVKDNFISPKDSKRKVANMEIAQVLDNIEDTCSREVNYENVYDVIEEVAQTADIGFSIGLDEKNKKYVFKLYKGTDRTISQSAVAPVIFSREFDNIQMMSYCQSKYDFKNNALILGANSKSTTINPDLTGLDRYEIAVDATNVNDYQTVEVVKYESKMIPLKGLNDKGETYTYYVEAITEKTVQEDTEIPIAEYKKMLEQIGLEQLNVCGIAQSFDTTALLLYEVILGDKITIMDKKWNITLDCRIEELEYIYENESNTVNVIFGKGVISIYDKIRKGL